MYLSWFMMYKRFLALLVSMSVFSLKESLDVSIVPRYLNEVTLSTSQLFISRRGGQRSCRLLLMIGSLVFLVLSIRSCAPHKVTTLSRLDWLDEVVSCLTNSISVVSSAYFTVSISLGPFEVALRSSTYREKRTGLSTQPWGVPVEEVREEDSSLEVLTHWDLSSKKPSVQLIMFGWSVVWTSLLIRISGLIVLNAEVKSKKVHSSYSGR